MTKSLFSQNVLGFLLVLCIAFIVDFFPRPHVEWFQSTEVKQFSDSDLLEEVLKLLSVML